MAFGEQDFRSRLQDAMTPKDGGDACPTCGASVKKIKAATQGGGDAGPGADAGPLAGALGGGGGMPPGL